MYCYRGRFKGKLEGLSESAIESASNEAKSRGMEGSMLLRSRIPVANLLFPL